MLMGGWRPADCQAGGDFVLGEWRLCAGRVVTLYWASGNMLMGGWRPADWRAGGDFVLGGWRLCAGRTLPLMWGWGGGGVKEEDNHFCNHLSGILYLLGLSSAQFIQRHFPPVLSKPSVTCNSLDRGVGGGGGGGVFCLGRLIRSYDIKYGQMRIKFPDTDNG